LPLLKFNPRRNKLFFHVLATDLRSIMLNFNVVKKIGEKLWLVLNVIRVEKNRVTLVTWVTMVRNVTVVTTRTLGNLATINASS